MEGEANVLPGSGCSLISYKGLIRERNARNVVGARKRDITERNWEYTGKKHTECCGGGEMRDMIRGWEKRE